MEMLQQAHFPSHLSALSSNAYLRCAPKALWFICLSIVITRNINVTSALACRSLLQCAVSYSSTLCCYANVYLCLFKFDLPGRKACISWGQKSCIIFHFHAILLLMLLSLKIECYHFPELPSYLPVSVRWQTCPNCHFEKIVVDVVKAFFFTAFSLNPPVTSEEGPQGHIHTLQVDVNQFVLTARVSVVFKAGVYFSS